jgi:3-oxoacyl-[acyl-carrier protein] reductase
MKKALILAGSRGIGAGIANSLSQIGCDVRTTSSDEVDTSNIETVERFILENDTSYDVVVLNTGGPPSMNFHDITYEDCEKYHKQLFYGFFRILQQVKINDGGYVFLISSYNVKEPDPRLLLSNAYRLAFISVFKCLSKIFAKRNITMINIAPGPIDTDRLRSLCKDVESLGKRIPLGRVGTTKEIGDFVTSIVQKNIKFLTGVTINFDGGKSNYVL